jgi:competence protein ComEC
MDGAGPLLALGALVCGIIAGGHVDEAAAGAALVEGAVLLAAAVWARGCARAAFAVLALAALGISVSARAIDGQEHSPFAAAVAHREEIMVRGALVRDPAGGRFTTTVLVRAELGGGRHRTVLAAAAGADAGRLRVLEAGDRVTLSGRAVPLGATGADERARVRHAAVRLDAAQVIALAPPRGLLARADSLRAVVLRGTRPLDPTRRALLAGFLLGDTRAIPDDVVDDYRDSGLAHLLAVSGENVAFVLALTGPVLRRLSLGGRTALALAIILVFAAMTRFEPSVLRASAMAAVALLAALAGRPASRIRVLAYAVIILLVIDPFLLRSIGFLLSVGASAGIAFGAPALASRLPGPRALREPLAVSLAAQLGVLPVLVFAFGDFPLITPFANLVAAPAAEGLGVYGLVASAAAGMAPRLGPLLQQPTAVLVTWVTTVARAGAAVPLHLDRRGVLGFGAIVAAGASIWCLRGWVAERTPSAEGPLRE